MIRRALLLCAVLVAGSACGGTESNEEQKDTPAAPGGLAGEAGRQVSIGVDPESWSLEQSSTPAVVRGRVADEAGQPLPTGTPLEGRVEWHRDPSIPTMYALNSAYSFDPVVVGANGYFELAWKGGAVPGYTCWVHLRRTAADGIAERAFGAARADVGTLTFERETLLASGAVVDEEGAPLRRHEYSLTAAALGGQGPPARDGLGLRWELKDGRYAVYGYRRPGDYAIKSKYVYHGPSGRPVPVVFGRRDLTVALPATGWLQYRLSVPKPFPERAVFAVIEDLDRDRAERRWLVPNNATNLRLLTGRYRVRVELNGTPLTNPRVVHVEHRKTHEEPRLDLRPRVHVFTVDVVDATGKPIPDARVRVLGSEGPPASRQRVQVPGRPDYVVLVATLRESVDLAISDLGSEFEPRVVRGVDGDRVLALRRKRR